MRRGYVKGLVIGGLIGVALGKMWKKREQRDESRFFGNDGYSDYNDLTKDRLDDDFDENAYLNEFSQYDDDHEEEYEHHDAHDKVINRSQPYINEFAEEIHDSEDTRVLNEYLPRRRRIARVQNTKRQKGGKH
ncbi:hypothetical protein HYG86_15540 [Alkalicella caledoniensis]|uniref:Uncharacterized protein n=1 Tax=Alkalicella caledoniensis TaxID=2731377 RepID=A0A7G9WBL7_ALKCA|nr:hypothetical protein [Alkalicella caledoniensis]QNO16079.1 hypothetical protein HYG86_15540 [Alkalicella caledoniensis]